MFDNKTHVENYVKDLKGHDNSFMIDNFKKHVSKGSVVIEFGCGIGLDYSKLKEDYDIEISEFSDELSSEFEKIYKFRPQKLDIRKPEKTKKYDAIYTSKVLPFISYDDIKSVVEENYNMLNEKGIIFHSFWYGQGADEISYTQDDEKIEGIVYNYDEARLKNLFSDYFDLKFTMFNEIGFEGLKYDSILLIGIKK